MRIILYLNSLELTTNNNIHKNQVLSLKSACKVPGFRILFLSPYFIVSRAQTGINRNKFLDEADEIKLPIASFNHYLNWFLLPYFIFIGLVALLFYCKKNRIAPSIIHTRGYPAALIAFYYCKLFSRKTKMIFDPRSVYAEEGVIIGRWKYNSVSFKVWKYLEQRIAHHSSTVFALSEGMQSYFRIYNSNSPVFPAVVDASKFCYNKEIRERMRKKLEIAENEICLIYSGSIGLWHNVESLYRAIEKLLQKEQDKTFKLYILTNQSIDLNCFKRLSNLEAVKSFGVPSREIPDYLSAADIGILPGSNNKGPAYDLLYNTMISSKVQEYLCTGLNVVISGRIKEVVKMVTKEKIGIIYDNEKDEITFISGNLKLSDGRRSELSSKYAACFSLTQIANGYAAVYHEMSNE